MRKLFLIFLFLTPCISYLDENNELYEQFNDLRQKTKKKRTTTSTTPAPLRYPTEAPKTINMSMTYFPVILNRHSGAIRINDFAHPEIAVLLDTLTDAYLCTAACIEDRIFVTAARCIADGIVLYRHLIYQNAKLTPIAFVLPLKKTKQMFDDIGFIVVKSQKVEWKFLKVTTKWKRDSQSDFGWFAKVPILNGTVVGHVSTKEIREKHLYKMYVFVSNYLCYYTYNYLPPEIGAYFVPCYHTCTLDEDLFTREPHYSETSNCKKYLAGEGHIVLDGDNEIIGVATWGPSTSRNHFRFKNGGYDYHELPIGIAIPNSDNFKEDLECARKIKKAPENSKGFVNLC